MLWLPVQESDNHGNQAEKKSILRLYGRSGSDRYNVANHPAYIGLALHGHHLPLALFLTRSVEKVFLELQSLPKTTSIDFATKVKHSVIDPYSSSFPSEGELDAADWNEAWGVFLRFFKVNASSAVYDHFNNHFEFCRSQPNFKVRNLFSCETSCRDEVDMFFTLPGELSDDPPFRYRDLSQVLRCGFSLRRGRVLAQLG